MIEQKINEVLSARRPSGLDGSGLRLWEVCIEEAAKLARLAQDYDAQPELRPSIESSAKFLFETLEILDARSRAHGVKSSVWDSFASGFKEAFRAVSPMLKVGAQAIFNAAMTSLATKSIDKIREW